MDLPRRLSEQVAVNTRPKVKEPKFIAMDKSTDEENSDRPLQTNIEHLWKTITFLTG